MASYTARKNKAGEVVSYQVKVSRGRDKLTGKQLTPYTKTYTPPEGWSKKAIERDLIKFMGEFETACTRGEVLTREQEKEKALEQLKQEKAEQAEETRRPTFRKYVDIYLKERESVIALNTLKRYKIALERAAAIIGDIKMIDIDMITMKKYVIALQNEKNNQRTQKRLSYKTVVADFQAVHILFENAVENGVIDDNPMRKMKTPKPLKDDTQKEPIVYDEEQTKYIIECLNNEPLEWKAFMMFAIDSGCRRGEIVALKWEEIDFKSYKVNVCRNAQYDKEKGVYISTPKSRKSRIIPINKAIADILQTWKREQAKAFLKMGIPQSGFCFTQENGEMMLPYAPGSYMARFGKKYNLPGIHPHALRHTMATISIANGADIVSISKKLGHATPSITLNVYSHANEEAIQRASEVLADSIYTDTKEKKAN